MEPCIQQWHPEYESLHVPIFIILPDEIIEMPYRESYICDVVGGAWHWTSIKLRLSFVWGAMTIACGLSVYVIHDAQ